MAQQVIFALGLVILLGFAWAIIYRIARPSPALGKYQRTGCLSGGCFVPFVFLVIAVVGGDPGGPLFWPLILIVGAMLGTILGTLYRVFLGSK